MRADSFSTPRSQSHTARPWRSQEDARALGPLVRRPQRAFLAVCAALALLTALDGYFAFAAQPLARPLARFVTLTDSFGVPAFGTAALTCAGCYLVVLIGWRRRVSPRGGARFAAELVLALVIGAALGYAAFGPVRSPRAALAFGSAGLILLGTTPVYEWIEIQLMGNPDYYAFDPTRGIYVFDPMAWRYVWLVSRAQELSELLALLCFVVSLLYVLAALRPSRRLPNVE